MPRTLATRFILITAAALMSAAVVARPTGAAEGDMLVPPTPKDEASAQLIFLPDGAEQLDAPLKNGERRVLMTGAYSSGDRFAPEGFVLQKGDASLARLQRWDGLLLIDETGRVSLHDVSKVAYQDRRWNLREKPERKAFLRLARREGLSAVQSHLLINDGALDLKDAKDAPRFRRRLLFETRDGRIGVYDSSPRILTLYEAAIALKDAADPRFALNLDMGNYDYCETQSTEGSRLCGLLNRAGIDKLTNVLAITLSNASHSER